MGAKQYVDGWLVYDEQFRIKKANYPSVSWAIVDQELWLLFMCRQRLRVDSFPGRSFKCYDFNYKGECKKSLCQYSHKCTKCNGDHSFTKCVNNPRNASFRSGANGGGFRQPSKPGMPRPLLQ